MAKQLREETTRTRHIGALSHGAAAICCGVALLAAGCGAAVDDAEPEGPTAASSQNRILSHEIQNGQVDQTTKAVVGMYTQQGQFGGICSGTLIAPNLVLTAQHCIASLNSQYVDCRSSRFGSTYSASNIFVTTDTSLSQQGTFFRAREVHVPPSSNSEVCGHDIALLILNQRVPNSITPPIEPRLDQPVFRQETYSAIGYGHTGGGRGSGTRRRIDDRRIQCGGSSACPT